MKRIRIEICLLTILLLFTFCACNVPSDDTPSVTEPTTVATTEPTISQPVSSLFSLLADANYAEVSYNYTATGGYPPVEQLPPANENLIGMELAVNLTTEELPIYFYYCKNTKTNTESLLMIMQGGARSDSKIRQPLLIVADVSFGGVERFKELLESKSAFEIRIVATANLYYTESTIPLPYIFQRMDSQDAPPASVPYPSNIIEYFGRAGGNESTLLYPRVEKNSFHYIMERHSMNEIMGIYVE